MHGQHNSRIARLVVSSNQCTVIVIPIVVDRFAIAGQLRPVIQQTPIKAEF
jgi:hypothetical protein